MACLGRAKMMGGANFALDVGYGNRQKNTQLSLDEFKFGDIFIKKGVNQIFRFTKTIIIILLYIYFIYITN